MKTLLLAIASLSTLFIAAPQAEARDRHDHGRRHYSNRGHSHHYYRSSPRVYYSSPRYYYPSRRVYYYDDYAYPRHYYPRRSGLSLLFRL